MKKLLKNAHIRVVSPSSSIESIGGFEANRAAKERLEGLGFQVSFSSHYDEHDMLDSASIDSRVADLHEAFLDDSVGMILTTIGGFNCNELLPYLDYELIKAHPKPFCGYSDTTALLNAIYAKTGLHTYMGPAYSSFKMKALQDYQTESWLKALTQTSYDLTPSKEWGSNAWYLPDAEMTFHQTKWKVYNHGQAKATAIGGNLSTFSLLRGTPYAPQDKDYILLLEEAEEDDYFNFDRALAALLQAYPEPKAVLIGRFPKECEMTEELLLYILDKYPVLQTIPVIYDMDFAHTQPLFTVTIGATVSIDTKTLTVHVEERNDD
ncbi:S66 family peptidase [Streptococcus himalayensis]|uniref:LD-carboxypeptidase n=1 Tax=Streptococcus himalayensis TaxID=1888195 RepID=A0A917A3S0_9STRE|nr:S66 peptidase family protein [Streptococcus himalayensis]GGE23575.1 LD-carboxypeptidase [Streptococcus himalayensis]